MNPAFVGKVGEWKVASKSLTGRREGIDFTGERRWWGGRWALTSTAPFPVPENVILYVSRSGMDHGFWRDLRVGNPAFDRDYFVFCDTPALLPLILGPAARRALADHAELDDALTLYVRGGVTQLTGSVGEKDPTGIDRFVAVHRALVEDHQATLARWRDLMSAAHGRAEASWPPVATIKSRTGTLVVHTSWTAPTSRDAADWDRSADSLQTHLTTHDDRERRPWFLTATGPGVAGTHQLAGKHVMVVGKPTISLPLLGDLVRAGNIVTIQAGAQVLVSMRGLANAKQIESALRIVELVVDTASSDSPYR